MFVSSGFRTIAKIGLRAGHQAGRRSSSLQGHGKGGSKVKTDFVRINFFSTVILLVTFIYFCLQPEPQAIIHPVDEKISAGLMFINFTPDEERKVREAMSSLFTRRCTQAFNDAGLRSPAEVAVRPGIVFRPYADLLNYRARKLGLRRERTRERYAAEFSSGHAQAGTISPRFKGSWVTIDGRPHVYLHDTAFLGQSLVFRRLSLRDVMIHEGLHVGGQLPSWGWLGPLEHDLAGLAHYNRIIKACR